MFDTRNTQLADSYQQFVESLLQNFRKIGSFIEALIKATQEKNEENKENSLDVKSTQEKDKEKLSSVDIQVGSEKYRLVPDEELPEAWKWESAPMTDFQEQTVLRRLVTEPAVHREVKADIKDIEDLSLSVVAHTESGESTVVYQQDSKGCCRTNIVTTNLEEEEIIDAINEVIAAAGIDSKKEELNSIADELLPQIVGVKLDAEIDKCDFTHNLSGVGSITCPLKCLKP